jgi:O-antigen ligase
VLILDGFYQYFTGKNILGWTMSGRVSSFFGEEKVLGSYLSRLWPIFFGLFLFFFKKKKNIFYIFLIIIFVLSEVLIFISGDRSAFFYINLSAFLVILMSKKLLKLRLTTLLISIFLIIMISYINPNAKNRVFNQTIEQMNLMSDKKIYIFSEMHHNYYISGLKMFLDNKLFGVGVKSFQNRCSDPNYFVDYKEYCNKHPHNTYIQILSETGIVGGLFLLAILFYFFQFFFKHLFLKFKGKYFFSDLQICFLSGLAIYLWPFIPTGNLFSNWLNIIMILNLSLFIWSIKLSKE